MQKGKWICWLTLLVCFLLPEAAWAAEVPEVTAEEYRYFLECFASSYLEDDNLSFYDDMQLREKLEEAVKKDMGDYRGFLIAVIWDDEEIEFEKYTDEDLEKFATRRLSDYVYEATVDALKTDYQIEVNPADYSPQELEAMYYRTALQRDLAVQENLSNYTWYELLNKYTRMDLEKTLQEKYGQTENLDRYTINELYSLRYRLSLEKELKEVYGIKEDLTAYDISNIEYAVYVAERLREEYAVTEDLSKYTLEELEELYYALEEDAWEKEQEKWEEEARTRVNIQINGENMYFTDGEADDWWSQYATYTSDVRPVMKDDRVYIPFRAVFEALGAEVAYDAASKTITAKRSNRTVSFTAGQPQYVMDGVTIPMDAQAFVQDGRTFVPVRFASQALGAAVGWDSENRTVVILERDKYIKRYQGKFTVLNKYLQHWDLGEGNLALQGNLEFALQMSGTDWKTGEQMDIPINLTMEIQELTSEDVVNLEAAVKLDMDKLVALLQREGALDAKAVTILNAFKDFRLQYILDVSKGKFYLKSELLDLLEGQKNAWYSVDIADYLEEDGYAEYQQIIAEALQEAGQQRDLDMDALVAALVNDISVTDSDEVENMIGFLDGMLHMVGDQSLGKTAEGYERSMERADWGYGAKLVFQGDKNAITGLKITAEYADDASSFHFVLEEQEHVIQFVITGSTEEGETAVTLNCSGQLAYSITDAEPVRTPEDGSPVYDLLKLIEDYAGSWYEYEEEEAA